ncbi:MAG TPA: DUF3300 domain-containing protein, partial [Candidatus Paceibacterota bacterium]|nr:DUF3300 domain-containing protein [Candidatus Paceibacterota bacterium]
MKIQLLSLLMGGLLAWPTIAADVASQSGSTTAASTQPQPQSAAPPPAAPPKRTAADLENLVAPIALYPDPLIATILPASVYPLEIVQAARFVKDTNNLAKLDQQPWDENVKAAARVPEVIQKMNEDLQWTISLGEAFLAQDKELMDAIQVLRGKAQKAKTLQTTPQQIVTVTNIIVEKTIEQQVVVVTNTVVQIQPSNPEVIYVPQYNPTVVYAPPPTYVYDPYAPLVTFGVGMAVGAIIANNCDWHYGGVYVGHHGFVAWGGGGYHGDVDIDINNNYNRNVNVNNPRPTPYSGTRPSNTGAAATQPKWQPDQNRLRSSGAGGTSASTLEARGWSSGTPRPSTQPAAGARPAPSTGAVATRPSTGATTTRPSTGTATTRPSTGTVGTRPSTGTTPSTGAGGMRPSTGAGGASSVSRPTTTPSTPRAASQPSVNRSAPAASSRDTAFSGASSAGNT